MNLLIDLHCHYVPSVDDGVRTVEEAILLLQNLHSVGFSKVVATPHMRPSLFSNSRQGIAEEFDRVRTQCASLKNTPELALSAEHFFDDEVYQRIMREEGVPYPGGRSVLVEFSYDQMPNEVHARFFDLRRKRLRPIVAHPERYELFWKDPLKAANQMRKAGGALLLDVAALIGRYGRRAQDTAHALMKHECYYAACTDAHRPDDVNGVQESIAYIAKKYGQEEVQFLFVKGPKDILEGRVIDESA